MARDRGQGSFVYQRRPPCMISALQKREKFCPSFVCENDDCVFELERYGTGSHFLTNEFSEFDFGFLHFVSEFLGCPREGGPGGGPIALH